MPPGHVRVGPGQGARDPRADDGRTLTLAEARQLLLAEHEQLRVRMRRCLELSARAEADRAAGRESTAEGDLADALVDLADAFLAHNHSELALLSKFLGARGEVGPLRVARMIEEHAAEHVGLRGLLLDAAHERWTAVEDVIEEIVAHMEAEERTFLSAAVLGPGAKP